MLLTVEDTVGNVGNCVETGTLDIEWTQPEVKVRKSEEKSRKVVEEPADDFGGLDWSKPLASASVKDDDDELKLEWSDDPDTEEEDVPVGGPGLTKAGSFKKSAAKSNSNVIEGTSHKLNFQLFSLEYVASDNLVRLGWLRSKVYGSKLGHLPMKV